MQISVHGNRGNYLVLKKFYGNPPKKIYFPRDSLIEFSSSEKELKTPDRCPCKKGDGKCVNGLECNLKNCLLNTKLT